MPAFTYQDDFEIQGDNDLPPLDVYMSEIESPSGAGVTEEPYPAVAPTASGFRPEVAQQAADDRATTISAVLISLSPWLAGATIGAVLVLRGFELTAWWFWTAVGLPYLLTLVVAAIDRRRLSRWGYGYPASWAWALLSAPVYLIARTRAVRQESEHGVAPLWLWFANVALVAGSVVALGMFGGVFAVPAVAEQVETEAEAELLADGEAVSVDCPIFYLGSESFLGTPAGANLSCAITTTPGLADIIDPAWINDFLNPSRVAAVYFERGVEYSYVVKSAD